MNEKKRSAFATKASVILHIIVFIFVFTYGYEYLFSHLSFPNPTFLQQLDQLTGRPYLINRIVSFLFAAILYLFFTLILERENWRKALFVYNPFPGLMKGAAYSLIIVMISLVLLATTKTLKVDGFAGPANYIFTLIVAWFIAQFFNAIKEEVIYRGYFLRRLSEKFNKHLSVLVVSVIFGIGHFDQYHLSGAVFATIFGLITGYLYLYYKNIYVPIGTHAVWDICSHTLLAGKIIKFEETPQSLLLGMSATTSYSSMLMCAQIIFLVTFFIWKKLWRLH